MKIIIDNKIPFIKEAVQRIADEVAYVPGKDFTPELVREQASKLSKNLYVINIMRSKDASVLNSRYTA